MKSYRRLGWFSAFVITCQIALGIVLFTGATVQAAPQYSLTCASCHQMPPLDSTSGIRDPYTTAVKGNHQTHAGSTGATCVKCHGSELTVTDHRDKTIQMQANINNSPLGANYSRVFFNQSSIPPVPLGSCSNTNCHFETITPAWGSASSSTTCGTCHNATPTTLSHSPHIVTAGIACTTCHSNHAGEAKRFAHATSAGRAISVIVGTYAGSNNKYLPSQSASRVGGSCSATVCHGSGSSPSWGTNSTNASCTKCHGKPTTLANYSAATFKQAAPGYAGVGINTANTVGTISGGVSNDLKVGAHDTHLRGNGGYKPGGVTCADCHANVTSAITFPGHMDGSTALSWSSLATNGSTLTPGYAAPNCSTNYCHGGGFAAAVQGTGTTVSWVVGTYLANPAATRNSTDCNQCHQSPPTASVKFAHTAMTIATDCSSCHQHNGNGSTHINGTLEATGGACNSCHSYDAADWATATHNFGGTVAKEGIGAHAKHIAYLKTRYSVTLTPASDAFGSGAMASVCGVCHTVNSANHTMSDSTQPRSINFGDGSTAHQFGASAPLYNGLYNSSSAVNNKSCSNIDCHYSTTPLWSAY